MLSGEYRHFSQAGVQNDGFTKDRKCNGYDTTICSGWMLLIIAEPLPRHSQGVTADYETLSASVATNMPSSLPSQYCSKPNCKLQVSQIQLRNPRGRGICRFYWLQWHPGAAPKYGSCWHGPKCLYVNRGHYYSSLHQFVYTVSRHALSCACL